MNIIVDFINDIDWGLRSFQYNIIWINKSLLIEYGVVPNENWLYEDIVNGLYGDIVLL
jgi:hypothetical protein